jgi:hypothetical protein
MNLPNFHHIFINVHVTPVLTSSFLGRGAELLSGFGFGTHILRVRLLASGGEIQKKHQFGMVETC